MKRLMGVPVQTPDPPPDVDEIVASLVATPGLYVHIPFCSRICPFCPYNKVPFQPGLAAGYLPFLQREVRTYTQALVDREPSFRYTSLYVGGGTPTLCLSSLDWFTDIPVEGERSIEILPSHMTPRIAARLRDLGFTYVSIGAQSFHDGVLRRLHRPTTAATNRRAVTTARAAFDCVDVDLIFDVGYDHPDTLLNDMAVAFDAGVDQVSTYPLMRFGYTPFGKARHDRRAEHRTLRRAALLAAEHGYRRDSVWTFVRCDTDARYSSITRPYYLGTGAGAASFTGRRFTTNHFGLSQYMAAMDSDQLPIAREIRLNDLLAVGYRQFWQTYTGTAQTASADDPLTRHPLARTTVAAARLAGWARQDDAGVHLTPRGYDHFHDLERWVTYHLIEPLWADLMAEHGAASTPPAPRAAAARAS